MKTRFLTATALALSLALPTALAAQTSGGGDRGVSGAPTTRTQSQSGTATGTTGTTTGTTTMSSVDRSVVGKTLYGANNEEVGEIDNVVMGTGGDVQSVLVDVGGFLGLGAKRVAIPVDDIKMEDGRLVSDSLTKEQVGQMPEHKQ